MKLARKRNSLSNAFNAFSETSTTNKPVTNNTKDSKESGNGKQNMSNVTVREEVKNNNKTETKDVSNKVNTDTSSENKNVILNSNTNNITSDVIVTGKTIEQIRKELEDEFKAKMNKKTVEETHTRTTFLLDNELLQRVEVIANSKKRGWKTSFYNKAIKSLLDVYKDEDF